MPSFTLINSGQTWIIPYHSMQSSVFFIALLLQMTAQMERIWGRQVSSPWQQCLFVTSCYLHIKHKKCKWILSMPVQHCICVSMCVWVCVCAYPKNKRTQIYLLFISMSLMQMYRAKLLAKACTRPHVGGYLHQHFLGLHNYSFNFRGCLLMHLQRWFYKHCPGSVPGGL